MKSLIIRSTKPHPKASAPQQQPNGPAAQTPPARPLSPCDDLYDLIATRAFDLCRTRGYRNRFALDSSIDAEREILSLIPPQPNGTQGYTWGSVKGGGSVTDKDYFLRFRHSRDGTGCGAAHNHFRHSHVSFSKNLPAPYPPAHTSDTTAPVAFDQGVIDVGAIRQKYIGKGTLVLVTCHYGCTSLNVSQTYCGTMVSGVGGR